MICDAYHTPPIASPPAASAPTAAVLPSPAVTVASPPAPGSATAAALPTSSESIQRAAQLARQPAPTANSLCSNIEWYAARPNQRPTPLTVHLWMAGASQLVRQYQDLLASLVELQVERLDAQRQMNDQLHAAAEEMPGGPPTD